MSLDKGEIMIDFLTNEECVKIWKAWYEWHHVEGSEFDEVWFGYNELLDQTGIEIKLLKKFMKALRDKGICYHSPCVDPDGNPRGSGNFIIERYIEKSWSEIKIILETTIKV